MTPIAWSYLLERSLYKCGAHHRLGALILIDKSKMARVIGIEYPCPKRYGWYELGHVRYIYHFEFVTWGKDYAVQERQRHEVSVWLSSDTQWKASAGIQRVGAAVVYASPKYPTD